MAQSSGTSKARLSLFNVGSGQQRRTDTPSLVHIKGKDTFRHIGTSILQSVSKQIRDQL